MSAKASGSDARANGSADKRTHHDGSAGRAFTVEQKQAVIRVRRCGATAFYDILGLESVKTTCSDSEIKKAYRKLSLLTHPDKNGYDGADEAFKSEWYSRQGVLVHMADYVRNLSERLMD
jgi:DnaJ family protein B protein 12